MIQDHSGTCVEVLSCMLASSSPSAVNVNTPLRSRSVLRNRGDAKSGDVATSRQIGEQDRFLPAPRAYSPPNRACIVLSLALIVESTFRETSYSFNCFGASLAAAHLAGTQDVPHALLKHVSPLIGKSHRRLFLARQRVNVGRLGDPAPSPATTARSPPRGQDSERSPAGYWRRAPARRPYASSR